MKASKFSDAEKGLKQGADAIPVVDICRKAGIGQAIHLNWKTEIRRPAARRDWAAEAKNGLSANEARPLPIRGWTWGSAQSQRT